MDKVLLDHTEKLEKFTHEIQEIINTFIFLKNKVDNLPDNEEWKQYKQRVIKLEQHDGNGKLESDKELQIIKSVLQEIGIKDKHDKQEIAECVKKYFISKINIQDLIRDELKLIEININESKLLKLEQKIDRLESKLDSNPFDESVLDKIETLEAKIFNIETLVYEKDKLINVELAKHDEEIENIHKDLLKKNDEISDKQNNEIEKVKIELINFKEQVESISEKNKSFIAYDHFKTKLQPILDDFETIKTTIQNNQDMIEMVKENSEQIIQLNNELKEFGLWKKKLDDVTISTTNITEEIKSVFSKFEKYNTKINNQKNNIEKLEIVINESKTQIEEIFSTINKENYSKINDLFKTLNENSDELKTINTRLDQHFITRLNLDFILNDIRKKIEQLIDEKSNRITKDEFDSKMAQLNILTYNLKNMLIGGIEELAKRIDQKVDNIEKKHFEDFDNRISTEFHDIYKYKQAVKELYNEIKDVKLKVKSLETVLFKFYELYKKKFK